MNRPRSPKRKGWPDHLNSRKKAAGDYYSWKHPKTGKEYGLGYSFADAAAQARMANLSLLSAETSKITLADRISETTANTMDAWLDIFAKKLSTRPSAKKGGTERAESTKEKDRRIVADIQRHGLHLAAA